MSTPTHLTPRATCTSPTDGATDDAAVADDAATPITDRTPDNAKVQGRDLSGDPRESPDHNETPDRNDLLGTVRAVQAIPNHEKAPHHSRTPQLDETLDRSGRPVHAGNPDDGGGRAQRGRPGDPIDDLRDRIDRIDAALLDLWRERAALSREVGRTRLARGGTRLVLAREQQILARFREALGDDGVSLALLLLRAGRGAL